MNIISQAIYLDIAESFRLRIASNSLEAGERLPSVRKTAQEWHCTPATVHKAYTLLIEEGLVTTQNGGGTKVCAKTSLSLPSPWRWTSLVNKAERFLLDALSQGYTDQEIETALSVAAQRWTEANENPNSSPLPTASISNSFPIHFQGSHDLIIDLLCQEVQRHIGEIKIEYTGSLGGLIGLAQGKASLAGIHLWDEVSNTYNIPFVQRILPHQKVALLGLALRSLGLMFLTHAPIPITQLSDLQNPNIRFINRQSGSGTRLWLDWHLQFLGIPYSQIRGYENEVTSHLSVAHQIAEGKADVGLGIQAAANAYELSFLPLTQEQYDLVIPISHWEHPIIQQMVKTIQSVTFQKMITALGGYNISHSGRITWCG